MAQASAVRPVASQPPPAKRWPEVRGRLLTGCLRQVQRDPLGLYQKAWRELGDYVRLRAVPGYWYYLLADPAAIEYVLHANQKNYRKPDVFNNSARLLAGNGILTSEGDFWRASAAAHPARLSAQRRSAAFAPLMIESIERFVDEWEPPVDGRTIDVAARNDAIGPANRQPHAVGHRHQRRAGRDRRGLSHGVRVRQPEDERPADVFAAVDAHAAQPRVSRGQGAAGSRGAGTDRPPPPRTGQGRRARPPAGRPGRSSRASA